MKIKVNYMKTDSNPSDDEIRSYMNFEKLVENARSHRGGQWKRNVWITLPVALAIVCVWLVVKSYQTTKQVAQDTDVAEVSRRNVADKSATQQPVEHSETETTKLQRTGDADTQPMESNATKTQESTSGSNETRSQRQPATRANVAPEIRDSVTLRQPSAISKDVYVQAQPRYGYTQLYDYFETNLSYPTQALSDSIEGIETVAFTIDESGRAVNIVITKSLGPPFDREAIRLIKEMPAWSPATLNARPVASQLSVPLTFQLKRIPKP